MWSHAFICMIAKSLRLYDGEEPIICLMVESLQLYDGWEPIVGMHDDIVGLLFYVLYMRWNILYNGDVIKHMLMF